MPKLSTIKTATRRTEALGETMYRLYAEWYRLYAECGEATETALLREGFSAFELHTLGPTAYQLAEQKRIRRTDRHGFTKTDEEIVAIAVDAGLGLVGDAATFSAMLQKGLTAAQIERNWTTITRRLGISIGTLPMPQVA